MVQLGMHLIGLYNSHEKCNSSFSDCLLEPYWAVVVTFSGKSPVFSFHNEDSEL